MLKMLTVMLLCLLSPINSLELSSTSTSLDQGRQQLDTIRRDALAPRFGECWKAALRDLEKGCRALDEDEQSYLSLQFANCFLQKSGLKTYPCRREQDVADCLEDVDANAFTAYSNFFTHTSNMCHFLQSQIWHEETENTISRLSSASAKMADSVEQANKVQQKLIHNQKETLEYQKKLVEDGSLLSKALEVSKSNVKEILEEFKSSTKEQKVLIFEIFDRVSKLQNLFVSEVSWLYTVVFYGFCLLVTYMVTATRRTAEARLPIYFLLTINFVVERTVCSLSLPDSTTFAEEDGNFNEVIYHRLWLLRYLSVGICFFVTAFCAYRFIDYDKVNNKLLQDIQKQNADLKQEMKMFSFSSKASPKGYPKYDFTDGMKGLDPFTGKDINSFDEGVLADNTDSDSDTLSFNSTQTDRTWMRDHGSRIEDEEEEDNFSDESLTGELLDNAIENNALSPIVNITSEVQSSTPKKRVRGSRSRSVTPALSESRYNLRSRKGTPTQNPVLEEETENDFARAIEKQRIESQRKFHKINMAKRASAFSSDED